MDNRIMTLINAIGKLRDFHHSREDEKRIIDSLNRLFVPDAKCNDFIYTTNTDKLAFGVIVMPKLEFEDITQLMVEGNTFKIQSYSVELDSKCFDYGLTDEQVVQMILFNIYHMVKNASPASKVREFIDDYYVESGKIISIKKSAQYDVILNLGICDSIIQLTSCMYLPNDIESDAYLDSLEFETPFYETLNKIHQQFMYCDNEASRQPKLFILEWCLRLYEDVEKERIPALHLLERCKELTASVLYINKFNNVITALNRIDTEVMVNESVQMIINESKKRNGLFAQLKYNGLRNIEDDLYEFQIRAKNSETENDVMYALKQINSRLAILDDYIRKNPNDEEIDRWISVRDQYLEIRDTLAKKKLSKHNYGIFVDYNAIDNEFPDEE